MLYTHFLIFALYQPALPVPLGPAIRYVPPAVDATGQTVAFGSTVTPQGVVQDTIDLYAGAMKLASAITSVALTADGKQAVFADMLDGANEGVGTVDIASGIVRRFKIDTTGCVRPLLVCQACVFACVTSPHATPDGALLYAVRTNQPFHTMNMDGSGMKQLPIYSGSLAPSPQRVISNNGLVVFTSAAPFGPTFAPAATDVYVMTLDGASIHNLTSLGNSRVVSSNAVISADGATVVFQSNSSGQNQIWTVQSDGSGLRQLTSGPDEAGDPSLSADGSTVVFTQSGRLYLSNSGVTTKLTDFRYSVASAPVISDDGSRVAFLLGPAAGSPGAVYEINKDGTDLHPVYAPRTIAPRGVVSAASNVAPSPGGLISVYGINFTPDSLTGAEAFPLPDTLADVSLFVNGSKLPLLAVSPWQINAQLPQETSPQQAGFQVAFDDASTTPTATAGIVPAAPALFSTPTQRGDVTIFQAAAFHAGTTIPADDDHPAAPGEVLEMYGTGLGVTGPPVPAGLPSPGDPPALALVTPAVTIGDVEAKVLFAGLTPGLAGVYQVNIVVPAGMRPGRYAVTLKSGDTPAGSLATITLR